MNKIKYLKKVLAAMACCMILSAFGCVSEEEQKNNINQLVDSLANSQEMISSYRNSFGSYEKNDYLPEAIGNSIKKNLAEGNSDKVSNLLYALESYSYKEESIKTVLDNELSNCTTEYLSGASADGILKCLELTEPLSHLSYYAGKNVIPFDKIMEFARKSGTALYDEDGKGGYYDNKKDQYKDTTSAWWDPLGRKYLKNGEIGTYKTYTLYDFYGDILRIVDGKTWWTNESTPNPENTRHEEYEIKGQFTSGDHDVFYVLRDGESYSFGSGSEMVVIGNDSDTFIIIDMDGVHKYRK